MGRQTGLVLVALAIPIACCVSGVAFAQNCQQVVQQIKQFDAQAAAAGGCPPPPPTADRPATLKSADPTSGSGAPSCTPDAAKAKAWWAAHRGEYDALTNQLSACNLKACPPIAALPPGTDSDGDGIPDAEEAGLIARFSPFLRFSLDGGVSEIYRPLDPLAYVQHDSLVNYHVQSDTILPNSTLATNPTAILSSIALGASSSLLPNFGPTPDFSACVNSSPRTPYSLAANLSDGSVLGADWSTVTSTKHTGMFAHVSPFTPNGAGDLPDACPRMKTSGPPKVPVIPASVYEHSCLGPLAALGRINPTPATHCYKIEYYQFFGLNNPYAPLGIGDHEGDWSILTVVYDRNLDKAVAISHWAHGYEMRFDLQAAGVTCAVVTDPVVGQQNTCTGQNAQYTSFNILTISVTGAHQDQPEKAQNNTVSLARDPATGEFSHPVAFVEYGSHEFWPTASWSAQWAPSHNGMDSEHSYLATGIPNLGEVEHPGLGTTGAILLGFSGSYGTWNERNAPPPGPILHKAWNWFAPGRTPIACTAAE